MEQILEELQGAVAESSTGSIGIIYGKREHQGEWYYVGISLRGRKWASRQPRILAYSMLQYISDLIETEIVNERKSYLDSTRRVKQGTSNQAQKTILTEVIDLINKRGTERRQLRAFAPPAKVLPGVEDKRIVIADPIETETNLIEAEQLVTHMYGEETKQIELETVSQ